MCGFPWGGLHLITGVFVLNLNEQREVLQAPMSRHRLLAFSVYLQIPGSVLRAARSPSGRGDEGQTSDHEKHVSVLWKGGGPGMHCQGAREEVRVVGTKLKRAEAGS